MLGCHVSTPVGEDGSTCPVVRCTKSVEVFGRTSVDGRYLFFHLEIDVDLNREPELIFESFTDKL